jgi:hypothetical protein
MCAPQQPAFFRLKAEATDPLYPLYRRDFRLAAEATHPPGPRTRCTPAR